MKDIILSLGGSIIVPDEIDISFLKKFRKIIIDYVKKGNRVAIIAGGGHTCRKYNSAAIKIGKTNAIDLDWMGIRATMINAELIRTMFSDYAFPRIITNPTEKIKTKKKIIIGSGWVPGFSSDKDAVLLAENIKIKTVVNLTNIDYVFDKDPKKFKNAKPIHKMGWNQMQKIVGTKWIPGANLPFDPVATKEARKFGLSVAIMRGTDLKNFKKFLDGKDFKGTIISDDE